jgi:Arc/MetJ-type ribon-helix-helix transcriptional regulator
MAMLSVRLSDELNDKLEDLVDSGVFKDKTDSVHEAVRKLLKEYDSLPS